MALTNGMRSPQNEKLETSRFPVRDFFVLSHINNSINRTMYGEGGGVPHLNMILVVTSVPESQEEFWISHFIPLVLSVLFRPSLCCQL